MRDISEPYFSRQDFTLYHADSLKLLTTFREKSIDMIFADPPYFLSDGGISCENGRQVKVDKGEWDKDIDLEEKKRFYFTFIRESYRLLKDDGTIWISGTLHNIYLIGVCLIEEGFSIINNITWEKRNPPPNLACRCFTNSTETIIWARKINGKKKGHHYFNYELMKELNGGKQMKDVWVINAPTKEEKKFGKHPAQKPLKLMNLIILSSTKEGDLILDPFCGVATTGIEAFNLHRRFIGIDCEKDYLEIGIKRYNEKSERKR